MSEAGQKAAEAALGKLSPVVSALKALLAKERMEMMATVIVNPLRDFEQKFDTWSAEASHIVADGGGEKLSFDVKSLAVEIANARKHMALANNMLAQLSRFPGP